MAQFVQTHHGGKALLYEGYKYLKIRDGKECTFWRCERLLSKVQPNHLERRGTSNEMRKFKSFLNAFRMVKVVLQSI